MLPRTGFSLLANLNKSLILRPWCNACSRRFFYSTNVAQSNVSHRNEFHLDYNSVQREKLLELINTYSPEELARYDISKARILKLQSWMNKNGSIKNIEDILQIKGFGSKILEKFCHSLLTGKTKKTAASSPDTTSLLPGSKRSLAFVIPSISSAQLNLIRSCVSIRVGVSSVTWSRLQLSDNNNEPCLLTHWEHQDIIDKKLHLNDLVQRCLYIDHEIPEADCYLFENPQTAQASTPGNANQQIISIQKSQITAVLSFALSARKRLNQMNNFGDDDFNKNINPNVFYLRRFLSARLFNYLVGTERVSSEETVLNLMRTYYNVNTEKDSRLPNEEDKEQEKAQALDKRSSICGNVQFPQNLRTMFSHSERYHREFLGQALLINLAFVRLVMLHDPVSISLVSRSSRGTVGTSEVEVESQR